jgi:hypothetical protein
MKRFMIKNYAKLNACGGVATGRKTLLRLIFFAVAAIVNVQQFHPRGANLDRLRPSMSIAPEHFWG